MTQDAKYYEFMCHANIIRKRKRKEMENIKQDPA